MSEIHEGETFDPLQLIDPSLADSIFLRAESAVETSSSAFPPPDPRPLSTPVRSAGVSDLLSAYASNKLTPAQVLDDLTAAIATDPSGSEAVVAMVPNALQLAEESGRRWRAGTARPLEGVPFGVKDIIDVEDALVTSGSLFTGERRAPKDAAVVASLRQAGAIPFVMTATTEFAAGLPANRRYGRPVTNPWDASRWAGGSSTGSGAAVAARLVPLALGTDTAGSIRVPSCWSGATGLKGTRELISRVGVSSLSWTLDHVGPIARSAADIARALPSMTAVPDAGLAAHCAELLEREPIVDGLRVGVPVDWFTEMVDASVLRNWQAALGVLKKLGCRLIELPSLQLAPFHDAAWTILLSELATHHHERLDRRELFDSGVLARILKGVEIKATDYGKALALRKQAQDLFLAATADVDVVVTPGVGGEASSLQKLTVEVDGAPHPLQDIASRNTMIFDMTGFPALMMPSGLGASGLPTGIQVAAKPHDDATCLKVGMAFQKATEFHRDHPPRLAGLV